ncbi:hypothetical protein INT47_004256 [Mucor saturninus]|uniref:Fungal lipase-type domain-containing protein n=1 Tax=Mucor saturninus TaxID=64648 RepID=A0A8H7RD33_9FUNG|nr:hypothetical protein INT47_004256 [Mucor saturninus]
MAWGASSVRAKLLFFEHELTHHPMIPGARVQTGSLKGLFDIREIVFRTVTDQLKAHPDYRVHVVGHSFGSAVGSLLTVDLFQRLPIDNANEVRGYLFGKPRMGDINYAKYVSNNKIGIKRYVEENDDIVHHPYLHNGYMHEGDEYWLKSRDDFDVFILV